jgi:hypothetical protein
VNDRWDSNLMPLDCNSRQGRKLQSTLGVRGPLDVLVIDSVQRPPKTNGLRHDWRMMAFT